MVNSVKEPPSHSGGHWCSPDVPTLTLEAVETAPEIPEIDIWIILANYSD
jgi:hypothetical protein